ncbi:MDR family MFS transporter [Paenibacillus guangzhouensis]|uniref:MDR family MFS transporter n=1 Tax=Paenibacillus guangzhouensis TaxID=1473112 RepID=UPI00126767A7|nr:MFS transporter [Paenibacillus guangzhouensis]
MRLLRLPTQLHPVIVILLTGSLITNLFLSMCSPFLVIYLSKHTSLGVGTIGFMIGAGALAGTVGGFIGGYLSDRIGRKKLMLLSLTTSSVIYAGYAMVPHPALIFALVVIGGFGSAFFAPVSNAYLADLTPEHQRSTVYSLRYMAVNIGFAVGPLIGLALGLTGSPTPFVLMAICYFAYAIVLFVALQRLKDRGAPASVASPSLTIGASWHVLRRDAALLFFVCACILTTAVEGLWSVAFANYLPTQFADGEKLLAVLLTVNSTLVILLQPIIAKWTQRKSPLYAITFGSLLFVLAELGYAFSFTWSMFILFMVIFTVGEILIMPSQYTLLNQITPASVRGTYFGAFSLNSLGNFIGPWLWSALLVHYNGQVMFGAIAVTALLSVWFYRKAGGYKVQDVGNAAGVAE